ncbi:WD40 repeat-like protein [Rhizodiscina lignyota]|uniref:WD40 repeat-like protein n=1 Tax=Rhizodiscina lignyota TaxID=1504668 RepID=A0A9P4IU39_9PEZI|nr:WD40 repeat-like protein [Rhizodiscina lignyota]
MADAAAVREDMETRRPILDAIGPAVLNVSFSSDNTCFAVAIEDGFKIYTSADCELRDGRDTEDGVAIAEMLGTTRYLALVGGGRQPKFPTNKVIIWCQRTQRPLQTLSFSVPVIRVHVNKSHYLVALQDSINLYANPQNGAVAPAKLSYHHTTSNPYGLCCLGQKFTTFLGQRPGQVWVVELPSQGRKGDIGIIPAHTSSLRALAMSKDEEYIATASEKGTIIRVFSTSTSAKIAEFRRGIDPAIVYGLAFSPGNGRLAATSDKGTLHIFELQSVSKAPTTASKSSAASTISGRSSSSSPPSNGDDWETVSSGGPPEPKWGALASVPIAPRIFRDTYSSASCPFELGDEPDRWQAGRIGSMSTMSPRDGKWNVEVPGWPGGRPPKGIVGWLSEEELVVIGAGQSSLWQSFIVQKNSEGKLVCGRRGWKKINDH